MSTTPLRIVLGKTVLVRMESLAGTGHKINRLRPKQFIGGKFEVLSHDPFVLTADEEVSTDKTLVHNNTRNSFIQRNKENQDNTEATRDAYKKMKIGCKNKQFNN